jgi:Ca2+/H+ antiporter
MNRIRTGYTPLVLAVLAFVIFIVVMAVLVSTWSPTRGTTAYFNGSW